MVNSFKESADGLALQITREARDAGLVLEDADGEPTRLAGVYVYGFDGVLLVIDAEEVSASDRAELVATTATVTGSVHRGESATVATAGNGYQVQTPGCKSAGFREGDDGHVVTAPGVLVIHTGDIGGLGGDLATTRREQVSGRE